MKMKFALMLPALALLFSCSEQENEQSPQNSQNLTFSEIGGSNESNRIYSVIFSTPVDLSELNAASKKQCSKAQWCKVMGWTDAAAAAKAFPMTDPEAKSQQYSFTLNRGSGMEEGMLACPISTDKENCFTAE